MPVKATPTFASESTRSWPRMHGPAGAWKSTPPKCPKARAPDTEEPTQPSIVQGGPTTEPATGQQRPLGGADDNHEQSAGCLAGWICRRPNDRRALHAARSPRRRRHGHRLSCGPDRAGQASGRAQVDQGRHGLTSRAGAVRRRATGIGRDGPPQHRPRVRRRHHRGRPAVFRDGVGVRRADHRVLRPPAAASAGPAGVVRCRLPGCAARPLERDHPPRLEARQRPRHRGRRQGLCPR